MRPFSLAAAAALLLQGAPAFASPAPAPASSSAQPSISRKDFEQFSAGTPYCQQLCTVLDRFFPSLVFFPADANYTAQSAGYWSQQQQNAAPVCKFLPTAAYQVSIAVLGSRISKCPFAVKSGGHASFFNASNIQGGLTVDLRSLKTLTVSADNRTTSIGTGNRWENVYTALDARGLAVPGGRNGDVGVGGLTLGGGISFFSGFYGWVCDNVRNYQLVTATGAILEVNYTSYPDLYYALRGGGNNFGIVTRVDMETFPHGLMWGGMTGYTDDKARAQYDNFVQFNANPATDPKAALIVAVSYLASFGGFIMSNSYEYQDPVAAPPVFAPFLAVPSIYSTQRIAPLSNITAELTATQPSGLRQIFVTCTLANDAQLFEDILAIFKADVQPIINIRAFLPSYVVQPLPKAVIQKFSKNGGNALGITEAEGPLAIMDINFTWGDAADDAQAQGIAQGIVNKAIALAKQRGQFNEYLYQNYAYIAQDVIASYGAASKQRLLAVADKYDPQRVFQELQPGYFKLNP